MAAVSSTSETTATNSSASSESSKTTENAEEEKKESESSKTEFTKTVTMAEAVRSLVKDVKKSERETEINRILNALKINPIQILQLSLDLDETNIKKQYRKISLLVHPDRCPADLKENAQRAFTMLNNCKKDLENKDFVIKLKHQINEARRRVIERKMIEKGQDFVCNGPPPAKKQKTEKNEDVSHAAPPLLDTEKDEVNESEIKSQLREILIDCAWQKRIEDQVSQKLEQQTLARREELKAQIKADKEYKKEWIDGRDGRVNNWRDFQKKKNKKKKKKKKKKQ